jgi:hypothetical protein
MWARAEGWGLGLSCTGVGSGDVKRSCSGGQRSSFNWIWALRVDRCSEVGFGSVESSWR